MKGTQRGGERRDLRNFGLAFAAMLIGLFGLLLPWLAHRSPLAHRWPWIAGLLVLAAALLVPVGLRPLKWLWGRFAVVMGWINTRIVLLLLFYLVITPMALVMRLAGRDPLQRRFDPGATSYRVECRAASPEQMEKPY